jgi:hypothetical protein
VTDDFQPQTDHPDRIDDDDTPVDSSARSRDETVQRRRKRTLQVLVVAVGVGLLALGLPWGRVLVALIIGYGIAMMGFGVLGAFARPVPEPPPPGELRRVKLLYRCSSCGAELRMTLANDRIPQAPRHCADEMDLMTALEDV